SWPILRQLSGKDRLGRGQAAMSARSDNMQARTVEADRVVDSVCPYCAVGCGQMIFVKDEKIIQIEGDKNSPVSRGRLCPKGSATKQLVTQPGRVTKVRYRRPYGTDWEDLDLDTAMDMIADRVIKTRKETWQWEHDGKRVRHTLGIASLGGATLDNEENYLMKKLYTAMGALQIENQARVWHSSTVPGLGTSFGRGGATSFQQDLANADAIVIEGSNMAECHPVGFQWVMEAKARGATIIHVDPRFTRSSAMADLHVPIRAGSDIAFLGGLVNYVLSNELDFREYVVPYTNAASIVSEEFQDTEDLDGLFSGYDPETGNYDPVSWQYEGTIKQAAAGQRDPQESGTPSEVAYDRGKHTAGKSEKAGSGGPTIGAKPDRDETLQDPRCVYQILKRHFARYTPEVVEEVCGISPDDF